jgi:hypothetical protein
VPNANATGLEVTISKETSASLKDLESNLRRAYAPKVVVNVLQRATLDGANALRPAVQSALPSGRMQKAVRAKASRFIKPASYVGISPGKSRRDIRGAWWAWIYVKGARPHLMKNRGGGSGSARALMTKNGLFAAVNHPGSKGKGPVVERAVEANLRTALTAMNTSITNFLVNKTFRR